MTKIFTGTVVSTKMHKTVVVEVKRALRHPLYKKVINRHKKYKVHNEDTSITQGDTVRIKESRPISKDKHFVVVEKVSK